MRINPVSKRITRKWKRTAKRSAKFTRRNWRVLALVAIFFAFIVAPKLQSTDEPQVRTDKLLDIIAKGESRGNYNAYFGSAANNKIKFTEMSVGEVLAWQDEFVKKGSPSSAVGKYQFIRPTLKGLVSELRIDNNTIFDAHLQDRLAHRLLERRGLKEYARGKLSREEFAHNLSKEWAALPRVTGKHPDQSYYAGDGLNKVRITREEIFTGIASLHY